MRTGLKVVLIIVVFIVCGLLITLVKEGTGRGSNSPGVGGPVGIIIVFAIIAGIRAIWKYNPEKKDNGSDGNHNLDKR
jgi:hypothetical protein